MRWFPLVTDDDGDFPVRVGKTLFYVAVSGTDDPVVQVFSFAVRGVPASNELLAKVNEINGQLRFCRMFYDDSLGRGRVPNRHPGCRGRNRTVRAAIATEFGGHLAFENETNTEEGHGADGHINQYL